MQRQSRASRSNHVLEVLEIGHLLDRPVTKFQAGKRSESHWPERFFRGRELLLLDEPLAALDIGLKEKILPYLGRVRDEFRFR